MSNKIKCGSCSAFDRNKNICIIADGIIDNEVHIDTYCFIRSLIGEQEATIEEQQEEIDILKRQSKQEVKQNENRI